MEIQYQNTNADYRAFYEELLSDRKRDRRHRFYYAMLWYLSVLALAVVIAIKHDEILAACVFVVLSGFYISQNWSFSRRWNAMMEEWVQMNPGSSCTLRQDDSGLTESFSGVVLHVPWSQFHDYRILDERLFIRFLKYRGFVIPLQFINSDQRDQLVKALESHGIHNRDKATI